MEEIQNILKPIEEADEREQQDSSRLKLKPRFDRRNNDKKGRSEILARRTVTNTTILIVPITSMVINTETRVTNKNSQETLTKKGKSHSKTNSNMIETYESNDEFEDGIPILEVRYDFDSESESDSEVEDSVIEVHLLQKKI